MGLPGVKDSEKAFSGRANGRFVLQANLAETNLHFRTQEAPEIVRGLALT